MYLMQALIFCAIVGSNIHWQWTPNQYLASGIGAGLALVATQIVVAWQDRRGRYKKMRPPGNAITATSSQAAFLGGSGGGLKFVWTPHSGRHSHGPLLAKSDVDLNQGSQMKDEPEEIERQRREYERMRKMLWATMRKILWAMSPLAIVFFVLWIVAYFWVLQE